MKDFIFADLLLSFFLFQFFLVTGVEVHSNMFLSISMIACRIRLIFQEQIKGLRDELRYTRVVTYCPKFLNTVLGPLLMWIIQYHVLDSKSETQDTRRMYQLQLFPPSQHQPCLPHYSELAVLLRREFDCCGDVQLSKSLNK